MTPSPQFLLDTNVVSELNKARPQRRVVDFLEANRQHVALSWFVLAELQKGASELQNKDPLRAAELSRWILGIEAEFSDCILGLDSGTARIWGELSWRRTRSTIDTFLAATAIHHQLTVVTRNVRDFADLPVKLLNPWDA